MHLEGGRSFCMEAVYTKSAAGAGQECHGSPMQNTIQLLSLSCSMDARVQLNILP